MTLYQCTILILIYACSISHSPKGWTDQELGTVWLKRDFKPETAAKVKWQSHDSLPDLVNCNDMECANEIKQTESQNNDSVAYISPKAKELIEFYKGISLHVLNMDEVELKIS